MLYTKYRHYGRMLFSILLLIDTIVVSSYAITASNDSPARKLAGFSRLNHKSGLVNAEYTFDKTRFRDLLARETINQAIMYSKQASSKETNEFIVRALGVFNTNHGLSKTAFRLVDKHIDEVGQLHIITAQYINIAIPQYPNGIRVEVAKVALHFNKNCTLYKITGQYMAEQNLSVIPNIEIDQAIHASKTATEDVSTVDGTPELAFIDERLVYLVKLREKGVPGWWTIVVDADNAEVLEKRTSARFLNPPPGYPNNGSTSQITGNIVAFEEDTVGEQVTVNGWHSNTDGNWYLFNNSEHWQVADTLTIFLPRTFHNDTSYWDTSNRIAMTIARNISKIQDYTENILSLNSFDGNGAMCTCWYVRWSTPWWTCWNGNSIELTCGGTWYTGVDSVFDFVILDVIAHEFGHALTQYHSDFNTDSGYALGEMYSDILGTCIESYYQHDGRDHYSVSPHSAQAESDWLIGEDLARFGASQTRSWFRNMREPLTMGIENDGDGSFHPSFYKGTAWRTNNEEHYNSTVGSHAFYLMSEGVTSASKNDIGTNKPNFPFGPFRGLGIDVARYIAWGAQFDGVLLSNATYFDCRDAWIETARSHGYDAGIVAQAWATVGVINCTVNQSGGVLPDAPPNYSSISQAVTAALSDWVVYVYPGTYNENLTINKSNLTLVGQNRDVTTINGTVTVNSGATRFVITGFTINGGDTAVRGITINEDDASICGNSIKNCDTGIVSGYQCQIIGNVFSGCTAYNIHYVSPGESLISENKFLDCGIKISGYMGGDRVSRNLFDRITGNGITLDGGTSPLIGRNFLKTISQNSVYGNANYLTLDSNVWTS
ncbi:MAG: M4 family metallopeptidase [Chitinispirillaceae bacterium]|nr:M4 family metallopeptidase [Chitinispirillaceae bacterium]